eukprot:13314252-Ditylum_brightwellii.AAC.1
MNCVTSTTDDANLPCNKSLIPSSTGMPLGGKGNKESDIPKSDNDTFTKNARLLSSCKHQ